MGEEVERFYQILASVLLVNTGIFPRNRVITLSSIWSRYGVEKSRKSANILEITSVVGQNIEWILIVWGWLNPTALCLLHQNLINVLQLKISSNSRKAFQSMCCCNAAEISAEIYRCLICIIRVFFIVITKFPFFIQIIFWVKLDQYTIFRTPNTFGDRAKYKRSIPKLPLLVIKVGLKIVVLIIITKKTMGLKF